MKQSIYSDVFITTEGYVHPQNIADITLCV